MFLNRCFTHQFALHFSCVEVTWESCVKRAKRITFNTYLLAILTLLAGVGLSLQTGHWDWFSRSGSLLVIYGILLTSQQILDHIQQLKSLQRSVAASQRDWAHGDKSHLVNTHHEIQWRDEAYGLYMLVAGTFIWGFGDLIGEVITSIST